MKDVMKNHGAGIAHGSSWSVAIVLLNRRFHWGLDGLEIAAVSGAAASCIALFAQYGRPIGAALYQKLLAALGAIFLVMLAVSTASATNGRVVLVAGEERTVLEETSDGEVLERTEQNDVLYLDYSVSLDLLVIDMSRPRKYTAGAVPGVGWGLRWCPEWWTLSESFLGLDLVVGGGLLVPEDAPVGATISALLAVTVGNVGSVGGGVRALIGFGDTPDDVVPTIALGLRYSP